MSILSDINGFLTDQFGAFGPLLALGLLGLFMILLAIPLTLAGTRLGKAILDRMTDTSFLGWTRWIVSRPPTMDLFSR